MTTLLLILTIQAAAIYGVKYLPKKLRYWLAKRIRLYANYCSPDRF